MRDKRDDGDPPMPDDLARRITQQALLLQDDLPLRARLKALELIVGQLVAEQLELSGDAAGTADAAFRALAATVAESPLYDIPLSEQERFRKLTRGALYEVLQHAVTIAASSAASGSEVLSASQK